MRLRIRIYYSPFFKPVRMIRDLASRFRRQVDLYGMKSAIISSVKYVFRFDPNLWEYTRFLISQDWRIRWRVLNNFRHIHKSVICMHDEVDLLRVASFILKLSPSVEGDIVECGSYNGGSTCKLSFIAKITNRKLIVCDSFEGLPDVLENVLDKENYFKKGHYSAAQSVFNNNVSTFGYPDQLEILPGWFNKTLPTIKGRKFVTIFEDADIYESVKCCLDNLWDGLQPGCRMYTHEMHRPLALVAYGEKGLIVKHDGKRSGRLGYVTKL